MGQGKPCPEFLRSGHSADSAFQNPHYAPELLSSPKMSSKSIPVDHATTVRTTLLVSPFSATRPTLSAADLTPQSHPTFPLNNPKPSHTRQSGTEPLCNCSRVTQLQSFRSAHGLGPRRSLAFTFRRCTPANQRLSHSLIPRLPGGHQLHVGGQGSIRHQVS